MKLFITLVVLLVCSGSVLAEDETVELTTYYPAPYGDYDDISTNVIDFNNIDYQTASPANTPAVIEGRMFYDTSDGVFKYSSDGTSWKAIGSTASTTGFNYTNAGNGTLSAFGNASPASSYYLDYTPDPSRPGDDFFITKAGVPRVLVGSTATRIFSAAGSGSSETELKVSDGRVDIQNATFRVDGNVKSFVIDHPLDSSKYLVHGCIEGAEAAVYYRGQAKLIDSKARVTLPDYFEALTREESCTIQLTPRGKNPFILSCSDIANGSFNVYANVKDGEFFWEVKAIRSDVDILNVEPDKDTTEVRGFGPYTYIE